MGQFPGGGWVNFSPVIAGQGSDTYAVGQDFTIGFARLDNAIWCYKDGVVVKVYEIESNVTISSLYGLDIFAWSEGSGNDFIEATISNVKIIYPD